MSLHEHPLPTDQVNNPQVAGRQRFLLLHLAGGIVVRLLWASFCPVVRTGLPRRWRRLVGELLGLGGTRVTPR